MRLAAERGAPYEEHKTASALLTDRDAARIFLKVERRGTLRSAAIFRFLSINAARRQIDDFKRQTGAILYARCPLCPADPGRRLPDRTNGSGYFPAIARGERRALRRDQGRGDRRARNVLACAVEFQQAFPKIVVDLHCAMRSALADVSRQETDVAIQPSWPAVLVVKPVRICRMHLKLFASEIHRTVVCGRKTSKPTARRAVCSTLRGTGSCCRSPTKQRRAFAIVFVGPRKRRARGNDDKRLQCPRLGGGRWRGHRCFLPL